MLARGKHDDVRKASNARQCAQQHPPGRKTGRGAIADDFGMLRQIGDQDADHEDTVRCQVLEQRTCTSQRTRTRPGSKGLARASGRNMSL